MPEYQRAAQSAHYKSTNSQAGGHRLLSLREVMDITGFSAATIYRLVNRGILKANRVTRHLRFASSEVDKLVNG